jgi:hypothetical protein
MVAVSAKKNRSLGQLATLWVIRPTASSSVKEKPPVDSPEKTSPIDGLRQFNVPSPRLVKGLSVRPLQVYTFLPLVSGALCTTKRKFLGMLHSSA